MTIRAIIVDDEPLARRGLELRLREATDVEIIRQCANGREALAAIAELQPDLMFLDIQMPGLSGFDVLKQVPQESLPMIVFVTAFDRFAIEAFEAHALDYLLMCVHAASQTHVLRATMKELEQMLDPQVFQRVHRSTIVNLARVRSLRPHLNGECFLKLESGQEVKLSRSFRDKVELLLDRTSAAPRIA